MKVEDISKNFVGETAVVTGAASGIGLNLWYLEKPVYLTQSVIGEDHYYGSV